MLNVGPRRGPARARRHLRGRRDHRLRRVRGRAGRPAAPGAHRRGAAGHGQHAGLRDRGADAGAVHLHRGRDRRSTGAARRTGTPTSGRRTACSRRPTATWRWPSRRWRARRGARHRRVRRAWTTTWTGTPAGTRSPRWSGPGCRSAPRPSGWPSSTRRGIWAGPVYDYADVLADPQVQHNGSLVSYDHPTEGRVTTPGFPYRFSATPPAGVPRRAAGRRADPGDPRRAGLRRSVGGPPGRQRRGRIAPRAGEPSPQPGEPGPPRPGEIS